MSLHCWLLLTVLASAVLGTSSVFIEEPSTVVVAENDVAVFRCRISSGLQGWVVGGVFVSSLDNTDISTRSESASDGGPPVHTLSIVGRSVYNGTTVQCFSLSFSGAANSSVATLQIQGLLAAVSELSATPLAGSILFSWAAPFSLNLTNTEPDITYCVNVLSSGGAGLVAGGCGLNETQYSFTADVRSPCDSFTAVVTPVNGAGNGTASQPVTGTFFAVPLITSAPRVAIIFDEEQTLTIALVDFNMVVYVCTCDGVIMSSDGSSPQVDTVMQLAVNSGQQVFTFPLNSADVPLNRIYTLEVLLLNSAGNTTSEPARLSTHDVQDLSIAPISSSNVEVTVEFAANSKALGCIVIVANATREVVFVKYRNSDSTTDGFTITGLPPASYDVAAFDLESSSGLPGIYAAASTSLETTHHTVEGSQLMAADGALMSEAVQTTSNDDGAICVRCTIPADINATECVVIAHPAGSLNEIKTLVVLNGSVNCTQVPDIQAYYVATFGRLDMKVVTLSVTFTSGNSSSLIVVVVPVLVGSTVFLLALVIIVTICACKIKRSTKTSSAIQVQTNSAYEFRKIRHRVTQPLPSASNRAGGGAIETGTNAAYESSTVPLPPPRSTAGTDSPELPHVYETVY